ncbi:hypothetical protein C4B63_17g83 [Trypanosoma cruzi]|uniref:Uncharacterized protein n=1 Tax=Trypanosoma cruzi TaxID=5693 RepID=A0A2V2VML9_TRYCR|nr:hypothetical protein C4B63_17g83 [Trypanosoma cruzi]
MASKSKKEPQVVGVLVPSSISGLPLWDDAQIQQENWGGSLGLPTRHTGAVVEFRNLEGKILVAHDEAQREAFKEALTHVLVSTAADIIVDWKRPVDIFAPFRPMVHRNITPFLFPYDTERTLFDGKAAEEAARLSATPAGKKGDSKNAVPPPLYMCSFRRLYMCWTRKPLLVLRGNGRVFQTRGLLRAIESFSRLCRLMIPNWNWVVQQSLWKRVNRSTPLCNAIGFRRWMRYQNSWNHLHF